MNFFNRRPDLKEAMKDEERLESNVTELEHEIDKFGSELIKIKQTRDALSLQIKQLRRALIIETVPERRKQLLQEKEALDLKINVLGERSAKDLKSMIKDTKRVNYLLEKEKKIDDDLLKAA